MSNTTTTSPRAASAVLRPGTMTGPAALQALGLVRFADDPGAQGAAGDQGAGQAGAGGTNDGQNAQTPGAGENGAQGGDGEAAKALASLGDDWKMSDLPEPVQQYIRSVRDETKRDRTTQQENAAQKGREEQLQKIAEVLGLAEEKPTEEKLTEQLGTLTTRAETAESRLAEYQRHDAIRAAANDAKINADAAIALKDTDAALADVDINDPKALQEALLTVADKHPHIKVASTVDQSGGDFRNGSGRPASDPKDLTSAVGSYYK